MFGERVLDAVPEVVFVVDPTGRLIWWNDYAREATGFTDAELASLEPVDLIPDEDRQKVGAWYRRLLEEGSERGQAVETELVTADGRRLPYEFVGAVLTEPDDEVRGVVATGRDITDRRARQELERQNERLEEFASVVSHDLRNPLTVADGYLSLAREEYDNEDLQRVADAHGRMYDLIEDLLTLAREGSTVGATERVSLAEAVDRAWHGVDHRDATLEVAGDQTLDADPSRLRELLENLFRNALEHARGADGTVTVTVGPLPGGGFFVADDGPGIPPEDREGIFESGYTTSQEGTGFGLAIVEGIAEAHGWRVCVTEAASGGARFEVRTSGEPPSDD